MASLLAGRAGARTPARIIRRKPDFPETGHGSAVLRKDGHVRGPGGRTGSVSVSVDARGGYSQTGTAEEAPRPASCRQEKLPRSRDPENFTPAPGPDASEWKTGCFCPLPDGRESSSPPADVRENSPPPADKCRQPHVPRLRKEDGSGKGSVSDPSRKRCRKTGWRLPVRAGSGQAEKLQHLPEPDCHKGSSARSFSK